MFNQIFSYDNAATIARLSLIKMAINDAIKEVNNDEVQDTKEYVEKHRIHDILQNLTASCVISQPSIKQWR